MPTAYVPAMVVVDVANVMGSRPDGWWRDRAGAATRLGREITALAERGIERETGDDGAGSARRDRSFPAYLIVLEGQARAAAPLIEQAIEQAIEAAAEAAAAAATEVAIAADSPRVRVVSAARSGDDAIVDEVAALDGSCLVVTADRELRRRCEALGASVSGPGWLLRLL